MKIAAPWRDPKTGIWKLRRRVPARYWPVAGNRIIKISTGTADREAAEKQWPGVLVKWAEMEAAWERAGQVVALDDTTAESLALGWARWIAGGAPLDTGPLSTAAAWRIFHDSDAAPDRVARMWGRVEAHADEALELADVAVTPDTRPRLLMAMQPRVEAAYMTVALQRQESTEAGRDSPATTVLRRSALAGLAPSDATSHPAAVTLNDLLVAWRRVATVKPRVAGDTAGIFALFERFIGHDDATKVTTDDFRKWRGSMKDEGGSNNTWNNRLSMVRQPFERAVLDGVLTSNPAEKSLRLPRQKNASPLPYSDEQAALILNASRGQARPTKRWAHWIMAFTGMRVGEVVQLSVSDLRTDAGIHYISVNEDGPGKSVKSSERRNIPIHPALIAEGLLDYAATVPQAGQLFPDKSADKYGMIGGRSYNIVGLWVRDDLGITDKRIVPDHSWRHRIQDELINQDVDRDIRDAICGHASKSTGAKYGVRGASLRRLADAISKIPVPPGVTTPSAHEAGLRD